MSITGMIAIGNGEKCPYCDEILNENQQEHLFEKHEEQMMGDLFPKGDYIFSCSNRECQCLKEGIGLYFTTDDIKLAEEHSRENNSPMWIAKRKDVGYGE